MDFTVAAPGSVPPPAAKRPGPVLAPLGRVEKGWARPGAWGPVKAVTADGQWIFELQPGGKWAAGHMPTRTVVKDGLRSPAACRAYVASGQALADLERITAEKGNKDAA